MSERASYASVAASGLRHPSSSLAASSVQNNREEGKRVAAALDRVANILKQVPLNEIKDEDMIVKLKEHHVLLTRYVENKVAGGQNTNIGTLDDLVQLCKPNSPLQPNDHCRLEPLKKILGNAKLVDENGCPSPLLLKLIWEILHEVYHLHGKGKAHGHLNPQSISICEERCEEKRKKGLFLRATLSSDSSPNTGSEISEWQAPEQRNNRIGPTRSADVYSMGKIFLYFITGEHPSKGWNTMKREGQPSFVKNAEADDLISRSLKEKPESRPSANEWLNHPLFWTPEKRLSFLRDTWERACDHKYSDLRNKLQNLSVHKIIGGTWDEKITDKNVLSYINGQKKKPEQKKKYKQRKKTEQSKKPQSGQNKNEDCMYEFRSVLDLVRLIRNMIVHYAELPEDVKQVVGTLHEGFNNYFSTRFPNLLIQVFKSVRKFCKDDK